MYHCNTTCQKKAWSDHHKADCKALITAKEHNRTSEHSQSMVFSRHSRFVIRLLCQHRTGRISEEQLAEVLTPPKLQYEKVPMVVELERKAVALRLLTRTALSKDKIIDLISIVCS